MKSYSTVFKVFFKGSSLINKEGLNLTFFGNSENYHEIPEFKSLLFFSERSGNKISSTKNIQEILPLGSADKTGISNFYVLLYSKIIGASSQEKLKVGYLVGNHNKKGHLLLGFWPYSISEKSQFIEEIKKDISSLSDNDNINNYEDVLLIT